MVRAVRAKDQAPFFLEVAMSQLVRKSVEKRRARLLKARPQVRKTFPPDVELRSLARSVIKRQLHPLIIMPDDTILDGECRWRGLMLENPDFEVDVIVVDRELTPGEVCELQLISAMHSTSLTAYDQALASKVWMDQNPGATAKELAEKIDRDPSMLTRLNSLWKTIPQVVKAAEEGKIGPKAWYQISLLPQSDQAGLLDLHISGATASQIAEFCRKKRTNVTSAVKLSRVKIAMPEATMVITGKELSMAGVVDLLSETLKEARKAAEQYDVKTFQSMMRDKAQAGG
jgi:ParB family transcriptional regulator, chromosome partitioning protein